MFFGKATWQRIGLQNGGCCLKTMQPFSPILLMSSHVFLGMIMQVEPLRKELPSIGLYLPFKKKVQRLFRVTIRAFAAGPKKRTQIPTYHASITHLHLLEMPRIEKCAGVPPRDLSFCDFFFLFKSIISVIKNKVVCYTVGPWQIFLLDDSNWSFTDWRSGKMQASKN